MRALAERHRNLCVVGDDDQSIYGWRGAEVEHILRFTRDWPDATVVRLEHNYRSTAEILDAANRLIAFNKQRHDKVLRASRSGGPKPRIEQHKDESVEARATVEDILAQLKHTGAEPRDFAILFRTNEQPRSFETELRRANLPYVLVGGMSFFDRREVRDVLAYLRLLHAPDDEVSLLRIINTPARGIGPKAVSLMMDCAVADGKTVWDILRRASRSSELPPAAAAGAADLVNLVSRYQKLLTKRPLNDVVRDLIDHVDYESELRRLYPDPNDFEARWAAVEEVVNALAAYQRKTRKPTLGGFLEEITLGGREFDNEKEKQLRRNAVALMTLHSAKGLEFPHVYMVGMEEGLLPHRHAVAEDGKAIDEERRLCYVGITRAQDRLTLSMALSRMKWGKPRPTIPSRFLYELTGRADRPQARAQQSKQPVKTPGRPAKKRLTGARPRHP